ncbi:LysR family transcriptional regulator [Actinospica durhamensis]|uniref:LysR family transcriptional regulator n=1 Tax=Actinospica durhamensis TaxID=1508375 RepID=A0A941EFH3_9ACTN|nr:LysR family transcriptional regulator [Actinospica durhamensis]MBR7831695.1 LysR family transcriptional regulator [Actinospica durhamensis]
MEDRLLRAFVAVADHGTYGAAARALAVTQPALTKQIQALEARVGGTLLRRGRQGAEPTALGRALLPDARDAVERLDAFALRARRLSAGGAGTLAVGFGLSTIDIAPRTVAEFRRRRPGIRVALDDLSSAVQFERLRRGELDAGFVRLPVDAGVPAVELGGDELVLAVPEGVDPEPGAEALISELGLVCLTRSGSPGFVGLTDRYLAAADLRPRILQRANDVQTVLALVAAGIGGALVSARAGAIAPGLRLIPVDHPAARWRIGLAWQPREPSPALAAFVEAAKDVAERSKPR